MDLEVLDNLEWMKFNAKLQQKKNKLRKMLKEKGVLKREAFNKFDKYSYFDESQYKELFTELFSEAGLELKFDELEYDTFTGTEKQSNGRMIRLLFRLFDIETGFFEDTTITSEAIDKGDKAGYKAYTGALKCYLANTFMNATGDDPDKTDNDEPGKESPDQEKVERNASAKQVEILKKAYTGANLDKLLQVNQIEKIDDISMRKASFLISKLKGGNIGGNDRG